MTPADTFPRPETQRYEVVYLPTANPSPLVKFCLSIYRFPPGLWWVFDTYDAGACFPKINFTHFDTEAEARAWRRPGHEDMPS